MNRPILIVIAAAGLAIAGFGAFMLISGGPVGESPLVGLGNPADIGRAPQPADEARPSSADVASFDAWAEGLRGVGLTVASDNVSAAGDGLAITGLTLTGPDDAMAWSWSASSARLADVDGNSFKLNPNGPQTLTLTTADGTSRWSITADSISFDLQMEDNGQGRFVAAFSGLSLQNDNDPAPITAGDGELSIDLVGGDGLVATGSAPELRVNDLVVPGFASGPLGSTIDSLEAEFVADRPLLTPSIGEALAMWQADPDGDGVLLNSVEVQWGALHFAGDGSLAIDQSGHANGQLEVQIVDPLAALDEFHTAFRYDRDLLANVYSALLLESGSLPADEGLPFVIAFQNGEVSLVGGSRGLGDVPLGTIPPIMIPADAP